MLNDTWFFFVKTIDNPYPECHQTSWIAAKVRIFATMKYRQKPIGVFDSGVGGLTVLRHLIEFLPGERFIYLGDTARVPYGNKSAETIRHYTKQCVEFLMEHDVKLIVVACNTASSFALSEAKALSDVPVVDVILPAAQAALNATQNGNIGVIGTRATVGSNAYPEAIRIFQSLRPPSSRSIRVFSAACPLFVPLAEEDWTRHEAARLIAAEYLNPLAEKNIDTLVLGCTHYPILAELITDILPEISLVDCGEYTAEIAKTTLEHRDALCENEDSTAEIQIFTTDISTAFQTVADRFLGFSTPEPVGVTVDHHHGIRLPDNFVPEYYVLNRNSGDGNGR